MIISEAFEGMRKRYKSMEVVTQLCSCGARVEFHLPDWYINARVQDWWANHPCTTRSDTYTDPGDQS